MKKILIIAILSTSFFYSCDKAFEQPADYSSVAVIHASPVSSTIPTDTLHVFVDTGRYTSLGGIVYGSNSGYLPILSGSKTINIRRKPNNASTLYVNTFTYNFERGAGYSFLVYDTTTSVTGAAKILRLKDDLTLPATGNSHIRFLHLAPNAPAVDITLLRTTVTPNDSITISNRSYIGATPNEETLAAFTPVPRGTYTVKVKSLGTQTVLSSSTIALTSGATINEGRIVTFFATGSAKGRGLSVGSFLNY